jgi:hypothetical protein
MARSNSKDNVDPDIVDAATKALVPAGGNELGEEASLRSSTPEPVKIASTWSIPEVCSPS